jgi:hypothetical protein
MTVLKMIGRLLRLGILAVFLLYWLCFLGTSLVKLIEGGPSSVVAWYRNTATWITAVDGPPGTVRFIIHDFNWHTFLLAQFVYFAITLLLCFFEWRRMGKRSQGASF